MKFENVKAGDNVLVREEVRIGWSSSQGFWLLKTVDKVTPKQFIVGNSRYRKIDGSCVRGGYSDKAKLAGEEKTNEAANK
jgi:hypothetical protein